MEITKLLRTQWDRLAAVALVVLGLVALFVGWHGASGTGYPAEQIPYILSGGLFALCVIAVGTTLWLSADLRDEWCKLDHLDATLAAHTDALAAAGFAADQSVPLLLPPAPDRAPSREVIGSARP
jgi:hypothetical protein